MSRVQLEKSSVSRWTFEVPEARDFVLKNAKGLVLNLFAGKTILDGLNSVRVDINPKRKVDYCMDAADFLNEAIQWLWEFDTIIYDPPWDDRKSKEKYEDYMIGKYTKHKNKIATITKLGGIIISAGYYPHEFGMSRGFKREDTLYLDPPGELRPWCVTKERKILQKELELIEYNKDQKKLDEYL